MKNMFGLLALALLASGCVSGPTLGAMQAYCYESGFDPGTREYSQCVYHSSVQIVVCVPFPLTVVVQRDASGATMLSLASQTGRCRALLMACWRFNSSTDE